mmetsp:Transcript_10240/g.38037  ORF Transcript_10240/g.38037 Transcript_10240/m.38037 type:complete len:241 (+) Transcript_10240:591-1313(+)
MSHKPEAASSQSFATSIESCSSKSSNKGGTNSEDHPSTDHAHSVCPFENSIPWSGWIKIEREENSVWSVIGNLHLIIGGSVRNKPVVCRFHIDRDVLLGIGGSDWSRETENRATRVRIEMVAIERVLWIRSNSWRESHIALSQHVLRHLTLAWLKHGQVRVDHSRRVILLHAHTDPATRLGFESECDSGLVIHVAEEKISTEQIEWLFGEDGICSDLWLPFRIPKVDLNATSRLRPVVSK